jgi:molybdopterin-guanine dinucleotide biosynthesis protein A
MHGYVAVVLAGGRGTRLGGPEKPTIAVAGRPMLARVLGAVEAARARVVVGPPELASSVPAGVPVVREEPPGGGPVAALAAGLAVLSGLVGDGPDRVVVLAADLPLLTPAAVRRVVDAVGGSGDGSVHVDGSAYVDGAVYVDGSGRRQWLCGAWRLSTLRDRMAELGPAAGRSLRDLFAPLRIVDVPGVAGEPPPWYDCDTPAAVAEAESFYGGAR